MLLRDDQEYDVAHGDCIEVMPTMPAQSVDLCVFSPPFPSVFAYSSSAADIGNSEDLRRDGKLHLSFFYRQVLRVLKPGRVTVVHVTQIHKLKRSGEEGVFDFRGLNIRLAERAGFVFDYDWAIRKNPQAQAIRTRKWELKFQGLETDRAMIRGAVPDYLLKFRAPGDNKIPVKSGGDVSRNDWIEWAECTWNVKETDTLNVAEGRGEDDTRHVCPLQLGVIDRLVRLYSNPNEIVFSPFAGIGSELYQALLRGRRACGIELKAEYYAACLKNLKRAVTRRDEDAKSLLDLMTPKKKQRGRSRSQRFSSRRECQRRRQRQRSGVAV